MRLFKFYILFIFFQVSLYAQTQISVPLGHPVYHVIEQAQMRGLYRFLPSVKPYSRNKVLSLINEILGNSETLRFGGLSNQEREILEQFRQTFSPDKPGLDLVRGAYLTEHTWDDVYFSGEFGFGSALGFSGAYYPIAGGFKGADAPDLNDPPNMLPGADHPGSGDFYNGINISVINLYFKGDLGRNASYGLTLDGGIFQAPRAVLGQDYTYHEEPSLEYPSQYDQLLSTYSEPLAYFPYTYKKNWDGPVWFTTDVSNAGHEQWPQELSLGYSMIPELAGILLNGRIFYRVARIDREWSGMTGNASLVLNQSAQPFLAGEIIFEPFTWLSFSALTGVLEHSALGIKTSSSTFQNAFSINTLEINYKNYFHFDFGSTVVWPKRFELGYLFPLADNFLYQNNIGDFDNMAFFLNLQGQYPGIGKIWFSFFLDEANPDDNFFELSKEMYAFQVGGSVHIPWLSFSSITLSYTKNEPYNYTHTRENVPWYGDNIMETNYVNNGRSLGHYIPPNSDEILVRFNTMPVPGFMAGLQYQLIRHGADYGARAVGGSSLSSELGYKRGEIMKYFLHDGAYQWMHIFKLGGEYSFTGLNLPLKVFCEIGGVYSYFTDIDSSILPNSGYSSPYSVVDTPEYPHSLSLIMVLGVKVFPKL